MRFWSRPQSAALSVVIGLLEDQKLQVQPLIGARIPFERAAEAYAMIDQSPGDKVKLLLVYD